MYQNGDKIDAEKLIQAVRELAAEQPDFVYQQSDSYNPGPACFYTTPTGEPDCIIGQAMARIGQALPPQLRDGENECLLLNDGVLAELWARALNTTHANHRWLYTVQQRQDQGFTWATAVRGADDLIS